MTGVCVRAGVAGDLAEVIALERATAEAPHWAEAEYAVAIVGDGAYVRRCLFVAEAKGAVIGFAIGKVAGDLAELESVAVDLQTRRGGVGRALCGAVIDWCREAGATAVELEVRATSGGAIGLYQGLGFTAVGGRPGYYNGPVDDAVLMRLNLMDGG
ncbi:MAG TPA: GNAT family N-acetyltransferase [Edaphobacter sp.]|nr:GNAT family N-acetyltransferase [Edaphobacter sp.]